MKRTLLLLCGWLLCSFAKAATPETDLEYPRFEQALRAGRFEEAYASIYRIVELDPKDPGHRYNMACTQALWGKAEDALNSLRWAARLGFTGLADLNRDPDLKTLRDLPEFAAVRAEIAANVEEMRTATTTPQAGNSALAGTFRNGVPQGMFIASQYDLSFLNVEVNAWYITPDGQLYEGLATGASDAELKAHAGRRGTLTMNGDRMRIQWSDGQSRQGRIKDITATGFQWDLGELMVAQPLPAGASVAGKYSGSRTRRSIAGDATMGRELDLAADGTYQRTSIAAFGGVTSVTKDSGRWTLQAATLTLTANDGKVTSTLCVLVDDAKTAPYPDQLFAEGLLLKRQ